MIRRFAVPCAWVLLFAFPNHAPAADEPRPEPAAKAKTVTVCDLSRVPDVAAGDDFLKWMARAGWVNDFGSPRAFAIKDGSLRLLSTTGPVYRQRYWLYFSDRNKLRYGLENLIALRFTKADDFRVAPAQLPLLRFRMMPLQLPHGADLRDPKKDDCAFYLLVGFDTRRYPTPNFKEWRVPRTVGYVWANVPWKEPVYKDDKNGEYMRFIPIGIGEEGVGKPHEVCRNVAADYRLAYPEDKDKPAPDVVQVGVMIASEALNVDAASALHWVRFEPPAAKDTAEEKKTAADKPAAADDEVIK